MTCKCPLCDNYIASLDTQIKCYPQSGLLLWHGGHAELTYNQAVLLEKILSAWPKSVPTEQLVQHYYLNCKHRDDPPTCENVRVLMSNVRKALKQAGAPIEIPPMRTYGTGYHVKFLTKKDQAA